MTIVKAMASFVENVRSIASSGQHSLVLDLPNSKGGGDLGPTALEMAVMSLADCAVTIFADIAKRSKVDIKKMNVVAEAEMPEDSVTPKGVKLQVGITAKAREPRIRSMWKRTEAYCPVVKIFTENIPVEFELTISTD